MSCCCKLLLVGRPSQSHSRTATCRSQQWRHRPHLQLGKCFPLSLAAFAAVALGDVPTETAAGKTQEAEKAEEADEALPKVDVEQQDGIQRTAEGLDESFLVHAENGGDMDFGALGAGACEQDFWTNLALPDLDAANLAERQQCLAAPAMLALNAQQQQQQQQPQPVPAASALRASQQQHCQGRKSGAAERDLDDAAVAGQPSRKVWLAVSTSRCTRSHFKTEL